MARRAPVARRQRLALMALAVSLAVAGLAARPSPPPAPIPPPVLVVTPRPPAPAVAALAPGTRAAAPEGKAALTAPVADPWMQPAREGADPAREGADSGTAPAVAGADEPAPPAPDVVVALERPAPEGWPRLVTFVHATDSAQPVPVQALGPVDAVAGSGDGIQGFEPGARYWFGPRGLEKLPISTEAQR